jgi:hypothetical protein
MSAAIQATSGFTTEAPRTRAAERTSQLRVPVRSTANPTIPIAGVAAITDAIIAAAHRFNGRISESSDRLFRNVDQPMTGS